MSERKTPEELEAQSERVMAKLRADGTVRDEYAFDPEKARRRTACSDGRHEADPDVSERLAWEIRLNGVYLLACKWCRCVFASTSGR